jgi:hypothetical protein
VFEYNKNNELNKLCGNLVFNQVVLARLTDLYRHLGKDYINAMIGFDELAEVFDKSSKSLMRMFGLKGYPQACNLYAVISYQQEWEGIHLEFKVVAKSVINSKDSSANIKCSLE